MVVHGRILAILICFVLLGLSKSASGDEGARKIWFLSNGFHTAVALRAGESGAFLKSTNPDPQAKWILFGWGDRDYMMIPNRSLWITLKAVFWPTPSAIHVIAIRQVPQRVYRNSEVIEMSLTPAQHRAFVRYLEEQFAGFERQNPVFLGPGGTPMSSYFLGNEKFYFPKMCNWWLATGFRKAGIPVKHAGAITAQGLTRQLRKHGRRVGGSRLPVDTF